MSEATPHYQRQQFASDNYAGICPEAWAAMEEANRGHAQAYGDDAWTARASGLFRELFERECEVFFVYNGTAANALALASLCRSYEAVVCAESAHVETDECGAPEFFSGGAKLLTLPTRDGKLEPDAVRELALRRSDVHFPAARGLSISQSAETGRVYTPAEVGALAATAHELGMRVHMDGARFANACAAMDCRPAELTWEAGVDVLCFGGTKNGMAASEAVVFFDKEAAREFVYRRKQAGQLASKMRFLTAPWVGMLESGAWLRHARYANACARHFAERIAGASEMEVLFPVEANAVFVRGTPKRLEALRERGWVFYEFFGGAARFMFAWDSELARVDALAADVCEGLSG